MPSFAERRSPGKPRAIAKIRRHEGPLLTRYNRPYSLPLPKREVQRSLRLGLGRLRLHFLNHGLEEYRETLFHACLKNLVYDTQCEAERAPWLVQLLTPEQEVELARLLLQALSKTRNSRDRSQQCGLCFHLARRGHSEARQALYQGFRITRDGEIVAADEIIDLDGADGLRWVSQQALQCRWLRDRQETLKNFVWQYESRAGKGSARSVFASCPKLDANWPGGHTATFPGEGGRAWQQANAEFAALSVGEVLAKIHSSTSRYSIQGLKAWAKAATREKQTEIADAFMDESDPHRLGHLLTVFQQKPLSIKSSGHVSRLLALADHQEQWVRFRANQALAEVKHPAVRDRAISQLKAKNWFQSEVLPLKSNLMPGDSDLFDRHLRFTYDSFQHHRLIGDLVHILQANPWPELLNVMLFVYETSPCTNCRCEVYQLMSNQSIAPEWVTCEWPHDAYHHWEA